jgi:regulator of RNase E activity RraA
VNNKSLLSILKFTGQHQLDDLAMADQTHHVRQPVLEALKRFTTCDVHLPAPPKPQPIINNPQIGDALVRLQIPHGNYLSGLQMFSPLSSAGPSRICGPAYTIRMVTASDTTSPSLSRHFADTIPYGSVVFVSQPAGLISACWGGLMSTRAVKAGAAGVVIDGRFRDVNEHRELGIGLYARGSSILGSNRFTRAAEIDVPVSFVIRELEGVEVRIRPGDLIMGDADGVVVVPVELADEVVRLCGERARVDEETRRCVEEGKDIGPTIMRLRK